MEICFDPKTIQQLSSIGFCFPTVHFCKFSFQFTGTNTVFISEIWFCIDSFLFLHDIIQSLIPHNNGIQYRISVIFEMVLLKERKTLAGSNGDISVGCFKLSGKNFKESRFSGTVGTDQAITVPFCEFNIYIFKQRFFADSQSNIICCNHN